CQHCHPPSVGRAAANPVGSLDGIINCVTPCAWCRAECPLSRSLLGVKRTWPIALHMSAFDPKRTSLPHGTMGPIFTDTLENFERNASELAAGAYADSKC